jgi:hypothetical protein
MYKSYPYRGQDPMVQRVLSKVEISGESFSKISQKSSVAAGTIHNWKKRKTMRPQFATMNAVLRSVGCEFVIANRRKKR